MPTENRITKQEARLTLSARDMPLVQFLRWVADEGGVSVVADLSLDNKPVSVEVDDVPVSQVLSATARRLGVSLTRTGSVFYLGTVQAQDRGILARKVGRLDSDQLTDAIGVLLTNNGKVTVMPDGLVLVGDSLEVLERVNDMLDSIERAPLDSWVVQMLVFSITESASRDLGLDLTPTLELSAALSNVEDVMTGVDVTAAVDGLLRASQSIDGATVEARPLFLLVDGTTSRHTNAESIPIPQRAITESGAVATTGFETVEVGFIVQVTIREVGNSRAMLDVSVDHKEVVGFVESAPISRGQTFETKAMIQSGGVYLLGEMKRTTRKQTIDGILSTGEVRDDNDTTVQIWARAYRIDGPTLEQEAPADDRGGVPAERGGGRDRSVGASILDHNTDYIHEAVAELFRPR